MAADVGYDAPKRCLEPRAVMNGPLGDDAAAAASASASFSEFGQTFVSSSNLGQYRQ